MKWQGCYDDRWQNEITPEAIAHPAKFSRALIRRIYTEALREGWIKPGDTVFDPFGGVGLGAKDALVNGINWIGIELEPRFVAIGAGCNCQGLSKTDYVRFFKRWSQANHKNGRCWCAYCISQAGQIDDSPPPVLPYERQKRRARITELQKRLTRRGVKFRRIELGQPIPFPETTSPAEAQQLGLFGQPSSNGLTYHRDGKIPHSQSHYYRGNLDFFRQYARGGVQAVLIQGDSRKLVEVLMMTEATRSSPPYVSGGHHSDQIGAWGGQAQSVPKELAGYGQQIGQIGQMQEGNFDAVVDSPPYAVNDKSDYTCENRDKGEQGKGSFRGFYGHEPGQLSKLNEGDLSAAITSPMFAGNSGGTGEASRQGIDAALFDRHLGGINGGIGDQDGNLGGLPLKGFDAVVDSPPYASSVNQHQVANDTDKRVGRMKAAGVDIANRANVGGPNGVARQDQTYGQSDGQLAALTEGSVDAALSSAPYAESVGSDDPDKRGGLYRDPKRRGDRSLTAEYGQTEGQLGAMVEGVLTSPPYEESISTDNVTDGRIAAARAQGISNCEIISPIDMESQGKRNQTYGQTPGNLGNDTGETFWTAARKIVEQTVQILKPGGVTIWVVKDFVRDGQRVPFCDQWRRLCEACGLEYMHTYRAMLVKNRGTQIDLNGDDVELRTERKSFFRRLAERKGSPRIDWEEVLVLRKPE